MRNQTVEKIGPAIPVTFLTVTLLLMCSSVKVAAYFYVVSFLSWFVWMVFDSEYRVKN